MVQCAENLLLYQGIRWFEPNGGQEEFINLVAEPGGLIVVSGAGNGWGKSQLIVAIFAAIMWPDIAPSHFTKHEIFKSWPHPKRARIYSTPAELQEIGSLQTAITDLFPLGRYNYSKNSRPYRSQIETDTGWVLDLFSYEQDAKEAAGPNIGLQAFNEPPPEPIYKEAIARARAGGLIIGGMTSLLENPWVVDGILDKANGKEIRVRYGDVEENCVEHGTRGHLRHSQIEKILAQYDPDEREARKTGKPLSFSGRIYKAFDRSVHVAKEDILPPGEGSSSYMVVDPAIGKPLAAIWAFVDCAKVVHIYDEWPEFEFNGAKDSNLSVSEYAKLFKSRENGAVISTRILDRHFGNARRTLGGKSLKQEFDDVGLEFVDSYSIGDSGSEVETGVMKVKELLRYDKSRPIDSLNRPRLIVSPRCVNTIAALERWSRNPRTGSPQEDFKDFADVVRYLAMADPEVETPSSWPKVSKPFYTVS